MGPSGTGLARLAGKGKEGIYIQMLFQMISQPVQHIIKALVIRQITCRGPQPGEERPSERIFPEQAMQIAALNAAIF